MSKECLTYIQAKQKLGFGGELAINPNELVTCYQCEVMGADVRLLEKYHIKQDCPADDDIEPGAVKIFGPYDIRLEPSQVEYHTINFNPSLQFKINFRLESEIIDSSATAGFIFTILNNSTIDTSIINLLSYGGGLILQFPNSQIFLGSYPSGTYLDLVIIYRSDQKAIEIIKDGMSEYHPVEFPNAVYTQLAFGSPISTNSFIYQLRDFNLWCPYV